MKKDKINKHNLEYKIYFRNIALAFCLLSFIELIIIFILI